MDAMTRKRDCLCVCSISSGHWIRSLTRPSLRKWIWLFSQEMLIKTDLPHRPFNESGGKGSSDYHKQEFQRYYLSVTMTCPRRWGVPMPFRSSRLYKFLLCASCIDRSSLDHQTYGIYLFKSLLCRGSHVQV